MMMILKLGLVPLLLLCPQPVSSARLGGRVSDNGRRFLQEAREEQQQQKSDEVGAVNTAAAADGQLGSPLTPSLTSEKASSQFEEAGSPSVSSKSICKKRCNRSRAALKRDCLALCTSSTIEISKLRQICKLACIDDANEQHDICIDDCRTRGGGGGGSGRKKKNRVSVGCPTPKIFACPDRREPFRCGQDKCWYANFCLAKSANFRYGDCSKVRVKGNGESRLDDPLETTEPNEVPSNQPSTIPSNVPSDPINELTVWPTTLQPSASPSSEPTLSTGEPSPAPSDEATKPDGDVDAGATEFPTVLQSFATEGDGLDDEFFEQGCPDDPKALCRNAPYEPVECGPQKCPYPNLCTAMRNKQDWQEEDCVPIICPYEPNFVCATLVYEPPVVCGSDRCEYVNLCTALNHGMEEAECEQNFGAEGEESCPYDPNLVCTLQGDVDPAPVVCGECEYVNICTAIMHSFAPADCQEKEDEELVQEECLYDKEAEYFSFDASQSTPVKCGKSKCEYPNVETAILNSFEEDQCKETRARCPGKPNPLMCEKAATLPVACGPLRACQYSSLCEATNGNGFEESECCRVPDDVSKCDVSSFSPVLCGENSCGYYNECLASRAGYYPESDCDDYCPTNPGTFCMESYEPVECGKGRCQYTNRCFSKDAFFSDEQCDNVQV